MGFGKYILAILGIIALQKIYNSIDKDKDKIDDYKLASEFLINGDLAKNTKPFLWIHLNYDVNARCWSSFFSRNTTLLNQPYHYITIKSIIDKCGEDFNICLIDDRTFKELIPGWTIDMSQVGDPLKSKIRELALAKILHKYGGCLVPGSLKCFKNLIHMYHTQTKNDKMFVGEFVNHAVSADNHALAANTRLMGCPKNNYKMNEYVNYLSNLISIDYTSESVFVGEDSDWCQEGINKKEINVISAELLGAMDTGRKIITIDRLMERTYIDLLPCTLGVYIPEKAILERTNYQWFARLSAEQAMSGNSMLSKLLLIQ